MIVYSWGLSIAKAMLMRHAASHRKDVHGIVCIEDQLDQAETLAFSYK